MTIIHQIAYYQNRQDEVPNQELATALANARDTQGIQEIVDHLYNTNPNIASDCIKVLYEIGYIDPTLISGYAPQFLNLLSSKHNRLVWGGMIAISTIADLSADELFANLESIQDAMQAGSVITQDAGVLALAKIASQNDHYRETIFPFLIDHLKTCRSKDIPQHSEKTLIAVDNENKTQFIQVLEDRLFELTAVQAKRVLKVIKAASQIV